MNIIINIYFSVKKTLGLNGKAYMDY